MGDHGGESSGAANEGTAAHALAQRALASWDTKTDHHVETYVQHVRDTHARLGGDLYVEERVEMPQVHPDMFGTLDAGIVGDNGEIVIIDLKYGYGIVEPNHNWQLICYAIGLLNERDGGTVPKITLQVVQPRAAHPLGPIRSWSFDAADLHGMIQTLRDTCAAMESGDPPITTGPHCRYCRAAHKCAALQQAGLNAIDVAMTASTGATDAAVLAAELTALEYAETILKTRKSALEGDLIERIKRGEVVPGKVLKESFGRLSWKASTKELQVMADMFGVSLLKETPITPTQAIKAGVPKAVVDGFAARKQNGFKLQDDRTQEWLKGE